jgi:hypothetical protein
MDSTRPGLTWVIVDGAPRHVSEFASLRPHQRPRAICPQCARQLTLKLGKVRRHHAAHAPSDVCASTQPETALHLDTKLALAAALARAGTTTSLSIVERCHGAEGSACDVVHASIFAERWQEVRVEHGVGERRRPDIVLLRHGQPLAAIEVLVSNRVTPEKAEALSNLGVPWIEVRADARLASPHGWTASQPLPAERSSAGGEWRCQTHSRLHAEALMDAAERQAAAREAERRTAVLRAARVVDIYRATGARDRFIYKVVETLVDGESRSIRLERDRIVVFSLDAPSFVDVRSAWPPLRLAFTEDVERLSRDGGLSDSPMRWATGAVAESILDEALADRVGRDPTPLATRYPRRWFFAPEDKRWFLPNDMRDVRWDRPATDAFAPHPAWLHRQSTVREHPAPEGSWSTPVFAQRPIAEMFGTLSITREADAPIALVDVPSVSSRRRVIVVVESESSTGQVSSVASRLAADDVDAVWLSHPRDWNEELLDLSWVPAGRDAYGHGVIVIDGLGVFRADAFMRAVKKGDRRLSGEEIRRRLHARVEALRARR